jgi:transposase
MKLRRSERSVASAAAKAGMDEKTARKYLRLGKPPSQLQQARSYRTRADNFAGVWRELEELLEREPGLEALTLMEHLCRQYPGKFQMGQLRTLQRRVKRWRAMAGPEREVFFPQEHPPGRQGQSDFTHLKELGVTIAGQPFDHLFYHFTLTCSNWETGTICFAESFESLAEGLQNALWELGAVPAEHRTDNLSAAIIRKGKRDDLTEPYRGLLAHYGLRASHNSPGRAHENGDVEQSHHRFKRAVEQALLLRGRRDFASREEYTEFLRTLLRRRNSLRRERLATELAVLRPLPARRLEDYSVEMVKVTRNSTITVRHNLYSVPSQLIGERVETRVFAEHLQVWFGGSCVAQMPRLRGEGRQAINYRHVIHSLVRKPGAFAHYRYQQCLFPRLLFRVAYDQLGEQYPATAERQYVKLLELAATTSEERVEATLRQLVESGTVISYERVAALCHSAAAVVAKPLTLAPVLIELASYDGLLSLTEEVAEQWSM